MISKLKEKFVDAVSLEGGFTLIELMIVIAIIGILAAVAIPQLTGVRGEANVSAVQSEFKNIQTQLELFYTQNGNYPTDNTEFESAVNEEMRTGPSGSSYTYNSLNSDQSYSVKWTNPDGDNLIVKPDGGIVTTN